MPRFYGLHDKKYEDDSVDLVAKEYAFWIIPIFGAIMMLLMASIAIIVA